MTVQPAYVYRAVGLRAIDGDTLIARIDLGFRVFTEQSLRLRGIDCPELREPGGPEAAALTAALTQDRPLVVQSYRNRMSFARWIADIWLDDGRSLAEMLIAGGHGTRRPD